VEQDHKGGDDGFDASFRYSSHLDATSRVLAREGAHQPEVVQVGGDPTVDGVLDREAVADLEGHASGGAREPTGSMRANAQLLAVSRQAVLAIVAASWHASDASS
jgi:hypothetical protein